MSLSKRRRHTGNFLYQLITWVQINNFVDDHSSSFEGTLAEEFYHKYVC